MLSNNKILLEKQVKASTIEHFVGLCVSNPKHERYMKLLTALCSCNGEAVPANQNAISDVILQNEGNKSALVMPVKCFKMGLR